MRRPLKVISVEESERKELPTAEEFWAWQKDWFKTVCRNPSSNLNLNLWIQGEL
jgi:hypothetical protein